MNAPYNRIIDRLDKKTKRDIILGKINSFVYNNKTYNIVRDDEDINTIFNDTLKDINELTKNK